MTYFEQMLIAIVRGDAPLAGAFAALHCREIRSTYPLIYPMSSPLTYPMPESGATKLSPTREGAAESLEGQS